MKSLLSKTLVLALLFSGVPLLADSVAESFKQITTSGGRLLNTVADSVKKQGSALQMQAASLAKAVHEKSTDITKAIANAATQANESDFVRSLKQQIQNAASFAKENPEKAFDICATGAMVTMTMYVMYKFTKYCRVITKKQAEADELNGRVTVLEQRVRNLENGE